jgi:hypothetical protein
MLGILNLRILQMSELSQEWTLKGEISFETGSHTRRELHQHLEDRQGGWHGSDVVQNLMVILGLRKPEHRL